MQKKWYPLIAVVIGLLVTGVALGFVKWKGGNADSGQETETKKRISQPVNQIEVSQRPYLQIEPAADGRNLDLRVVAINKPATDIEYELEYQAGSLLQGAFGEMSLDKLPVEKRILLGSCSAGGACTYHSDIKGGTLVARLSGGDDGYAVKQDWRYFDNADKDTEFASKDAKFQLESKDLAKQRFVIIYNTPGLPEQPEGTVISDPYSLTTSGSLSGEGTLSIRANEEADLTIMGYDGEEWTEFETTTDGKTATAEVDLMELYVVVKK